MIVAADVFEWLGVTVPKAEAVTLMGKVVAGVVAHVTRTHTAPLTGTADWDLALTMQAGRIWKRKDSPEGVLAFGADGSAIRVTRIDADIADMLTPFLQFNFA